MIRKFTIPVINANNQSIGKYYGKIYAGQLAALEDATALDISGGGHFTVPSNGSPDPPDKISSMLAGMPVFFPLTFEGGTYADLQGRPVTFPTVVFETVLCTTTGSKNLVFENVNGRDGSVKEMMSMGDWEVEVRAIIPSPVYGQYPAQAMYDLLQVISAPIAIPVTSRFLLYFDIHWLVIKNYRFEQIPGEYSQQRLVLDCVSDKPLIVKLVG